MKLRFEIEVDSEKDPPVHEELEVRGGVADCVAGCVRLINMLYSRMAKSNKDLAEKFRQAILVALLHPDSPAFEIDPGDVGNITDISAVFLRRRKE